MIPDDDRPADDQSRRDDEQAWANLIGREYQERDLTIGKYPATALLEASLTLISEYVLAWRLVEIELSRIPHTLPWLTPEEVTEREAMAAVLRSAIEMFARAEREVREVIAVAEHWTPEP